MSGGKQSSFENGDSKHGLRHRLPSLTVDELYLGNVLGSVLDDLFYGRTVELKPEQFNPVCTPIEGGPVHYSLDVYQVFLLGPGPWETEVVLTARDDSPRRNLLSPPTEPLRISQTVKVLARVVYADKYGDPIEPGYLFDPPCDEKRPLEVKRGTVQPLEFRIYDCFSYEVSRELGGGPHRLTDAVNLGPKPGPDPHFVGAEFRYEGSRQQDGRWLYELKIDEATFIAGNKYRLAVVLNDSTAHFPVIHVVA